MRNSLCKRELQSIYHTCKSLILASASPRRQEYLLELGLDYRVHAVDIDETPFPEEKVRDFVRRMAVEKARPVMDLYPDAWIVAADTVVSLAGSILGKPKDCADAVSMLMQLSGKEHWVQTGVCLACRQEEVVAVQVVSTRVTFSTFSKKVAQAYVATGEPMDKAGSYGIQGKGAFLVREIMGSYSNVVGLPLSELLIMLEGYGIIAVAA
ncbi:MAG: septum formation inhibitor Maf [Proteobacteria bacterium]|nr:septum formation inhibitor Maf [Pseudomonadota bacterium]MBU1648899.1 septum formation inhibitor Maf [Pseudomonadota bacterium]